MKTIRTAGSSFLTGTEIADAVMAYGLALARVRELDVVDIPLNGDGAITRAEFRIGWLIDTVITTDEQRVDELMDVNTILACLRRRIRSRHRTSRCRATSGPHQGTTPTGTSSSSAVQSG